MIKAIFYQFKKMEDIQSILINYWAKIIIRVIIFLETAVRFQKTILMSKKYKFNKIMKIKCYINL